MKKIIEESGLKLKEFAELYNIPYNTVRQWYNGTRQTPPYIKKMIEKLIELKSKGKQLSFENMELDYEEENRYFVKIIHVETKTTVYSRTMNYKEYLEFETNYWYVEYINNKKGYKVNYYLLNKI